MRKCKIRTKGYKKTVVSSSSPPRIDRITEERGSAFIHTYHGVSKVSGTKIATIDQLKLFFQLSP